MQNERRVGFNEGQKESKTEKKCNQDQQDHGNLIFQDIYLHLMMKI